MAATNSTDRFCFPHGEETKYERCPNISTLTRKDSTEIHYITHVTLHKFTNGNEWKDN